MAKEKLIEYPTQEWIDAWVDKWMDKHPNERVEDFKELEEQATAEWWDKQIDKGNPTPFDLTDEQQKAVKATLGNAKSSKERKQTVRERKPNEEKRALIQVLYNALNGYDLVEIANIEKEITFKIGETAYSVTLTAHRKPKK